MLHPIKIRGLTLGDGIPKVCIPIVAADDAALRAALQAAAHADCDLVEYRADIHTALMEAAVAAAQAHEQTSADAALDHALRACIAPIRESFPDKPLLFTVRTAGEGGQASLSFEAYAHLLRRAAALQAPHNVDLIDMELLTAGAKAAALTADLQRAGVKVIGSSHDFNRTPPREEMLRRLLRMQEAGMDISKLAVMPQSRQDVLELLSVTCEMNDTYADRPFVTMSMGPLGLISRLSGGFTGSAFTFASAGKASAPGQISVESVRTILGAL